MGTLIFIILSTAAALYAAYLLSFRTYEWDCYSKKKGEKIVFPRITYIFMLIIALVPILNISATVTFILFVLFGNREDFYVESWFFDQPKDKNDDQKMDNYELDRSKRQNPPRGRKENLTDFRSCIYVR